MKTFLHFFVVFFAVSTGAILAVDLHRVSMDASKTFRDADVAIIHLDSTAQNLSTASAKFNHSVDAQLLEFQKTQAALREVIVFTDKNLNAPGTGVLPQLREVLTHTDGNMATVAASFQSTANDLHPALVNFADAGKFAARDLNSPLIDDSLANMNRASFEAAGAVTDVHAETTLLVGKTRDAFKPKNKALTILQMVIGNTVTGAELFYYLSH
jgi:hypothetical protein